MPETDDSSHPPLGATAIRPAWVELPEGLREFIAGRLGADVVAAEVQGGGFTPGVAARLRLAGGERVFVKAIPDDHVLAAKYRTEALAAARLPRAAPAPRLRWHDTAAGWFVLAFDDIHGRHPRLSPGSPDIPLVTAALAIMGETLTPCPLDGLPQASAGRARMLRGWRELAGATPPDLGEWERHHLPALADLEELWPAHADGDTLVHGDIRPDNLLITHHGTAYVVDWAQPCQGAAWQDVTDLIPHMIMAGHTPGAAEKTLVGIPTWDLVPAHVITSYAASFAGYWTRSSRLPAPPAVPHLRAYQRRAAAAAIAWTKYRTGW
ncbi:hypothetical protein Sru01_41000 [Sphaerisporangium rufum]|uniref:Aminoglycoside phosphotransferase domain-containing protein n=1 Tax=Sphaerisporangium rufum TaxID=1381558 RepID=A0A919R4T5_9ACTN|nr:phosphotransferase [Sphaerisporangium rufum]GII79118.1 hypothetical protein Sru01_41000 [Sphaerisporangium rufum]